MENVDWKPEGGKRPYRLPVLPTPSLGSRSGRWELVQLPACPAVLARENLPSLLDKSAVAPSGTGPYFIFTVTCVLAAKRLSLSTISPARVDPNLERVDVGNLLHRIDSASHGSHTPVVEELADPGGAGVLPESLEVLLQQMASHGFQIVLKDFLEFCRLFFGLVLETFQEQPPSPLEDRLVAVLSQLLDLGGTHLVQGLAHPFSVLTARVRRNCLASRPRDLIAEPVQ